MSIVVNILNVPVVMPTAGDINYANGTTQFFQLVSTALLPTKGLYNTTTGDVGNLALSDTGTLTLNGVDVISGVLSFNTRTGAVTLSSGDVITALGFTPSNAATTVGIASGGTGATTAPTALNNLAPAQTGQAGKVLGTDGTNITWVPSGSSINANTLVGTTLASSVVNSSLTSVGTLTSLSTGNTTITGTASISSNATVGGTLGVTGNTTVGGTLGVTGNLTAPTATIGTITGSLNGVAANASLVNSQSFPYYNPTNTPTYVWSSNGSNNNFLAQPAGMSVNYANSCGTASNSNAVGGISGWAYSNLGFNPAYIWATNGSASSQFLVQPGNLSVNYANSCGTANNLQGLGPGSFVQTKGSAVINMYNAGSSFLESDIGGFGAVIWSVTPSDERIKENIADSIEDSLSLVKQINFKSFHFKVLNEGTETEFKIDDGHLHKNGVISQQLQTVNPDWVIDKGDGSWITPNKDELLYSALKAIQQLSAELDAVKAQLQGKQ